VSRNAIGLPNPERYPAFQRTLPQGVGICPAREALSPSRLADRPSAKGASDMIEALKSEEIVNKVGGRFKLCVLIQRRIVQLMDGARPLVAREGRSDLEIAIEEIMQDKITLDWDESVMLKGQ
jgi:DNA-directed RNA polymerase subunit omega